MTLAGYRTVPFPRNSSIPDPRRKPTQKPIMCWVFQLFEGLYILWVKRNGEVTLRRCFFLLIDPPGHSF